MMPDLSRNVILRISIVLAALMVGLPTLIAQSENGDQHATTVAPRFEGLGTHRRTISTQSPEAQLYFNQGLNWMYSFNHDEAIRSFLQAAKLDPTAAMPWWAIAYCEGPNYNDDVMTPERSKAAWYALQNALSRRENGTAQEIALIEALQSRYQYPAPEDRTHLESNFAEAMAKLWKSHPKDPDIGTLYADSLMVQRPWKLYSLDGIPEAGTDKILATLNQVLKLAPNHPGALHLYIHATEPSRNPEQGLDAAQRLGDLVPAQRSFVAHAVAYLRQDGTLAGSNYPK